MKATNEKKVDIAKDILVAYIGHLPDDKRDVDSVCVAAKRIFDMVESLIETQQGPSGGAGFRL